MDTFTERMTKRVHDEIVYLRGMLAMYKERNIAYGNEYRDAVSRKDFARARELARAVGGFLAEMRVMQRQLNSAIVRDRMLRRGGDFHDTGE